MRKFCQLAENLRGIISILYKDDNVSEVEIDFRIIFKVKHKIEINLN